MQKLRKLLPILFALVLIVATVVVLGITASADTTTVNNVWLVSTPYHSQRAYNGIKYTYYGDSQQSGTATSQGLNYAYNNGWGADNVIQYAAIAGAAYSSNTSSLSVTVAKLAGTVDKAEVDKLWGVPVVITIDTSTNEVTSVVAQGTVKVITSERLDSVAWDGGAAFFLDGVNISTAGGFNSNGKRWKYNVSSGGYFDGYALQTGSGFNSGTIAEYQGHANNSSNTRYATAATYAPDILTLVDMDNNGTYDWSMLRGVTRGTATVVDPGTAVTFSIDSVGNSSNGNNYTISGGGGVAWLTGNTGKHYAVNGGTLDTGAEVDGEYYIMPTWGNASSGWDGVYYEMWEVGNAVSDLRVEAKSGTIAYNSTASDLNAYVKVYGTAEAIATITDISYDSVTGYITVTATYLGETETWSQFLPTGITVTSAPTKTVYDPDEAIDTTGLAVALTWQGGSAALDLEDCTITSNASSADLFIRISYTEPVTGAVLEAAVPITMTALPVGIEIVTPPDADSFEQGSAIDPTGMVVNIIYDDESIAPADLAACTITALADAADPRIVVTYGDFSDSIDITVTIATQEVTNIFLVSTPNQDIRAYSGMKYTYFGGSQNTNTSASTALTYANNNGWGMNNVVAYQVVGSTSFATSATTNTAAASMNVTIVRVANDAALKAKLDSLWWLPVTLTLTKQADGIWSVTDVEVLGTLTVVTSDRVDGHNDNGNGSVFFLDGVSIHSGFNTNNYRWAWNTSNGGVMKASILQGSEAFGVSKYPQSTSSNPRYDTVATYAPDVVYFVDIDNDGNNDFEWCFIRSTTRATTTVVNPGSAVTFSFADGSANGNAYSLTGFGGSAWLTGNTVKHYRVKGGAYDTGAAVGNEYYIFTNVGGYNASGFGSFYYDLYPVGNAVENTFTRLELNSTSFASLDEITTDMIDGYTTVYGIAEAKVEITGVEVTGEDEIAVTGLYLEETVTGVIEGIEIKSLTGIEFSLNSFINSAADVTTLDLTVYKVYSDGSREYADEYEIDSIEVVGLDDDTIRVTVTDAIYGGTVYAEGKLWYRGDYYISATKTKNHRLGSTGLEGWTITAGAFSASNTGNIVLQSGFTGNYVNLDTAYAVSPADGTRPSEFILSEYTGSYSDIESHYMMPVTVYFGDEGCTTILQIEFNENDPDVISTRDINSVGGQYYVGADAVEFDEDAILYFRGNGQYIVVFSVSAFLNNCANGTYANAGNVYALDSDGDGDYDWLYYEPIYYLEGVHSVGTGANSVPTVRFVDYTREGGMPAEADSSVYNWFKNGLYRYGNHGGTITSDVEAGETNYYLSVYMDTANTSAAGAAYYIMYAEDGVNGRYYPTTLEATTNTVANTYVIGTTFPVADLPAIHVVRNDGSSANIKLTADQVNNAAELVFGAETESFTVNATVDGRTIEFTVGGFSVIGVEDVTIELARGKSVFVAGNDYTAGMFNISVTLADSTAYEVENVIFSKAAPEIGDTSLTVSVFVYGSEFSEEFDITVIGNTLGQAYFQITSGTTGESAKTDLRFVAGIADLEHVEVGFVFSLTDSVLDIDFLEGEDFAGLSWTQIHSSDTISLWRATFEDNTYFKIITRTVYDSIYADGARVKASDLNSNYLFACTFTNVPNSYFGTTFAARPYTKTTVAPGSNAYEYSSTLTAHTISEMIG